jgi:phenylalanine-4-hydroxylase
LDAALCAATGWRVRPTAGLLHPRDFLAGLAFSCFHSTQYVRHASRPDYTPEPDLVHEAIGHVPMLADVGFGELARGVGAAALGADDAAVWALTKVYWHTVEFGVVMEDNVPKAFGAGILSSVAEMENLAAGGVEIVPFDPFQPLPKMAYRDGVQRRYYTLSSFSAGAARLAEYCEHVRARLPPGRRAVVEAALEEADAAAARRRGGAGAACAR